LLLQLSHGAVNSQEVHHGGTQLTGGTILDTVPTFLQKIQKMALQPQMLAPHTANHHSFPMEIDIRRKYTTVKRCRRTHDAMTRASV
jgi:hypothetical protein